MLGESYVAYDFLTNPFETESAIGTFVHIMYICAVELFIFLDRNNQRLFIFWPWK